MLKFTEKQPRTNTKPFVLWVPYKSAAKISASFTDGKCLKANRTEYSDGNITGSFSFPTVLAENLNFCVFTDCKTQAVFASDSLELKEIVQQQCEKQTSFVSLVLSTLLSATYADADFLLNTEKEVSELEQKLLENKQLKNNTKQISRYRKMLLKLKQHYESLGDVTECFTAISAQLDEQDTALLDAFEKRIARLVGKVSDLREYLTEIREAHQSQVDINQNKLMKTFTVITAVFMPLQLITGWYGMNITMPETQWKYTYLLIIVVCALTVAFCLWIFKRNKYL